jgi:hypothetical protein
MVTSMAKKPADAAPAASSALDAQVTILIKTFERPELLRRLHAAAFAGREATAVPGRH